MPRGLRGTRPAPVLLQLAAWLVSGAAGGSAWSGGAASIKDDDSISAAERELAEERATQWLDEDDAKPCPECAGARLNPVARNGARVRLEHRYGFARLPVTGALAAAGKLRFKGTQELIARDILEEIRQRLTFMNEVGLGYLSLDRSAKTLSAEARRNASGFPRSSAPTCAACSTCWTSPPSGYIRAITTACSTRSKLCAARATRSSSWSTTTRRCGAPITSSILAPVLGVHGGEVVAQGTLAEIQRNPHSYHGSAPQGPDSVTR